MHNKVDNGMNLKLRLLERTEIPLFSRSEEEAFRVHDRYFPDGNVPGASEDDRGEFDLKNVIDNPQFTVLGIYDDNVFCGGTIVEDKGGNVKDISIFFLIVEYQGKGIGKTALEMVEAYFPDARLFRLITPSQVVRNVVFYVNKCGYRIVKVIDFNKEANTADYVFEKRRRRAKQSLGLK